jgi:formylglycine-generating enzyme required for sulfatase activity
VALGLAYLGLAAVALAADPVVWNVRSSQRSGTKLVDITYDASDADGDRLNVSVAVSVNGGVTYDQPARTFWGSGYGGNVTPGFNRQIVWDAGKDWDQQYSSQVRFKIIADDGTPAPIPGDMLQIPAGNFQMGDSFTEGGAEERPVHTVPVSAFYMDMFEVTKSKWTTIYTWATNHGYKFENAGQGKANNHPVHTVNWYDTVKWCNARSEMEGLTPCYYVSSALLNVYKSNNLDVANDMVKWTADGYRLPTEAEWEKAARGGFSGKRFPWGDTNVITHAKANYRASTSYTYDKSTTLGYHPDYDDNPTPYTSPVGSFPSYGYGLYDMAGNVWEWCWDWYSSVWYTNVLATQSDPRGPATTPSYRVLRGVSWDYNAYGARCATRGCNDPSGETYSDGFRCVRRVVSP